MDANRWVNIAHDRFANGEYEEALVASEEALRIDSRNYKAWFIKGDVLHQLERYEVAQKAFEEALTASEDALRIDSRNYYAWFVKAYALYRLERYEETLEAFGKASDLKPEEIVTWRGKGFVLHNLKRDEEALEAYRNALRIDPNDLATWHGKASAYLALKRYEEALEAFNKVIEMAPNRFAAHLNRGIVLGNLGKYTEAVHSFDKAIELNGLYTFLALGAKAKTLLKLKKYKDASVTYRKTLDVSQRAIENNSQNSLAWCSKGDALAYFKRYEESLKAFYRVVEIKPQDSSIWNNIGVTLSKFRRYEEAQEAYVKAIEMDPDAESPYANLGELLLHLGCIEKASEYAEKALQIEKKCVNALALKGRVQIEEGKYDDAAKLFEEAVCLDPGNLELLLWDIYAQYLSIEFCLYMKVGDTVKIPENVKGEKYLEKIYKIMRETKYQEGISAITRKLERVRNLSEKHTERDLREFILYYLGYFYYKGNDIFRAKKRLEECIVLESRRMKLWEFINSGSWKDELSIFIIKKSKWEKFKRFITAKSTMEWEARELLNCIWICKIRPTWWNWWCSSPVHRWLKRSMFVFLLCLILSAILYLFTAESVNRPIYVVILVTIIILLSPSIQSMKAPGVEVELHSPPPLEPMLSLLRMEEGIERFIEFKM